MISSVFCRTKKKQQSLNYHAKHKSSFLPLYLGETLAEKFKTTNNYRKYVKKRILNSFFLSPVVVNETLKEIAKLDDSKAGGDDNMKPGLVKENRDVLADKITHIRNLSFKNGVVPDKLKLAKVIPIFKKIIVQTLATTGPSVCSAS